MDTILNVSSHLDYILSFINNGSNIEDKTIDIHFNGYQEKIHQEF